MKKMFLSVVALVTILISNFCFAAASKELSLGGISLGMTYQQVVAMYGEPTLKYHSLYSNSDKISDTYIQYGNNVEIKFSNDNGKIGTVTNVFVTANNGWKLNSGLAVGNTFQDFCNAYGVTILEHPELKDLERKDIFRCIGKGWHGEYYSLILETVKQKALIGDKVMEYPSKAIIVTGNGLLDSKITTLQISKSGHGEFRFCKDEKSDAKIVYFK